MSKKVDRVGPLYALAFGKLAAVEMEMVKFRRVILEPGERAGLGCGAAGEPICRLACVDDLRATLPEMRTG